MVQSVKEYEHEQYLKRKEYMKNYYSARYKVSREAQAYAHAVQMLEAIDGKPVLEQVRVLQEYVLNNFKFKVQTTNEH